MDVAQGRGVGNLIRAWIESSYGLEMVSQEPCQLSCPAPDIDCEEVSGHQGGKMCCQFRWIRVSIRTGMFNPDEAKYANGVLVELPYPTDDTRLLTKAAQEGVGRVFREGFRYSKAEVLLLELSQPNEITADLFAAAQPAASEKLMGVLDAVNGRWGRGTMRLASVPVDPSWGMRRELMSQSFTTRIDELWTVYCK